ncbi:oxidoreductase [soil metagenome]
MQYPHPMRLLALLLLATLATTAASAQWQIQNSHTTASLRGIHALGNGVAWASGTQGTVLRTTDDGITWQTCSTPPDTEKLDFRGIQAFDANTAIVMSSGKGDLSRLYKTTDACKSWKLVFTNPDKEGFWDAIRFDRPPLELGGYPSHDKCFGVLLGDPVEQHFVIFLTNDCGEHWERQIRESPVTESEGEGIFAASNSSLEIIGLSNRSFITGGKGGPRILSFWIGKDDTGVTDPLKVMKGARPFRFVSRGWLVDQLPAKHRSESSGAFSFASGSKVYSRVIVGGNYKMPADRDDTGWYRAKHGYWTPSKTPPSGYRSSVAYDPTRKTWITVGPNGTDISTDDGKNWKPLKPSADEAPDSDKNWNALSLPFVVGPKGRIAKLNPTALKP